MQTFVSTILLKNAIPSSNPYKKVGKNNFLLFLCFLKFLMYFCAQIA